MEVLPPIGTDCGRCLWPTSGLSLRPTIVFGVSSRLLDSEQVDALRYEDSSVRRQTTQS